MKFWFVKIISNFLLPPGLFILLLVFILILDSKSKKSYSYSHARRYLSVWILIVVVLIYLLSSYLGEFILVKPLEEMFNPLQINKITNQPKVKSIIVVLGGGIVRGTPRGVDIGKTTLRRLYEGWQLHESTGYDLAVTGGVAPGIKGPAEAKVMRDILISWGVNQQQIIVEDAALNTWLNAVNTTTLLERLNYKRIILVTSATHMTRSLYSFEKNWDYQLIPAPADYLLDSELEISRWLPNRVSLDNCLRAIHEWFGLVWYYIQHT